MSRYGGYPNPDLCRKHGVDSSRCKMCGFKNNCKLKKAKMNQLIEDYDRRLKTVLQELKVCKLDVEKETRLSTKASCYRTFIAEMKRIVN